VQADVADTAQVQAAIQQALAHFGAVHGVFHTAGVPGVGLMQLKTAEAAANVLAPKIQGTLALARALRDVPLDFLVLFSSVTSATGGGPGQADYCAANAFLDVYARYHAHDHGRTLAISWGEWLWDAWQDGLQGFPEQIRASLIANRRAYGISFEEGMEALRRILSRPLSHIFVTTQNLNWMVEGSRQSSAAAALAEFESKSQTRSLYPRPTLSIEYVTPEGELEEKLVAIWGEVLGIDQIGRHDNFFELGGNSLIGLQIIARLRQMFQIPVPLVLLFETPTVAEMAIAVEIMLIEKLEKLDESELVVHE
jgi:NAD(P)-dependent dehydrogenase (short-subunit alcohol dehydrogenase family)